MRFSHASRVSRLSVAVSIFLVLTAMMLPVCHLHPLLDKSAPDHCTICISLHAALPIGVHPPSVEARMLAIGRVFVASIQAPVSLDPRFAESRAPPSSAC